MSETTIEVITMWFQESLLAPFFLKHYSFADHIRIIDDVDTTDNTAEIVAQFPNATLEKFQFPDMFDNDIAVAKINECYRESKADWVIAVDSDEFVLTENLKEFLSKQTHNIFYVRLYQVYRNINDKDLDVNLPIKGQRRCGDAYAVPGQHKHGMKPIIARAGLRNMKWMPGQHNIWNKSRYGGASPEFLLGVHWMYADPLFAIERKLRGRARQSKHNLLRGHCVHYNTVTEEEVRKELESHLHDKELF